MAQSRLKLWKHFSPVCVFTLLAAFAAMIIAIHMAVQNKLLLSPATGWLTIIFAFLVVLAFVNPILCLARTGYEGVKEVGTTTGILVFFIGFSIYFIYFCFSTPSDSNLTVGALDKILNIPPILVAAWAAIIGWYVSFQAAAKNLRTSNALALATNFLTNSELVSAVALVRTEIPANKVLSVGERDICPGESEGQLSLQLAEMEQQQHSEATAVARLRQKVQRAKALNALKTLLNFYEFMAVGIAKKDLDEDMLYQTISARVVSHFDRGKVFINYAREQPNGGKDLVFIHLSRLVEFWREKLDQDQVNASKLGGAKNAIP